MPRYSIVVTTVNRPEILRVSLCCFLAMQRDDFELIVSDNFSTSETARIISGFQDPRLRTFRTDRRLPMPDHWEWIWTQTCGEYVIFVGDDSVLTPDALAAADTAIEQHDADIVSWRCGQYYHPDWQVQFRHLPNRGNILAVDLGFTEQLFRVNERAVLRHFCDNLRLAGCFPSVINFLVRRSLGEEIRQRTGRFHWAPCPDISSSYFALAACRPGHYVFWDGLGGIGGRSGQSNIASLLSRGKTSKRLREWLDEFDESNPRFPHHPITLESITNLLAAPITQAATLIPEKVIGFDYELKTLVLRSIDDTFIERTVPWAEDPDYLAQLNDLIAQLPDVEKPEVEAYLETARAHTAAEDSGTLVHPNPTPPASGRGLVQFLRSADDEERTEAWRLFKALGRNPIDKVWRAHGTLFVDLSLFGGRTLADAPKAVDAIRRHFANGPAAFAEQYRGLGMLTEALGAPGAPTYAKAS